LTATRKNLESALTGECQAHFRYLFFSELAARLGRDDIAQIFRETAQQEATHAKMHLRLLYPELTIEDALKIAIEAETQEYAKIYPDFEKTAGEELEKESDEKVRKTISEAKKFFSIFSRAEKVHAERNGSQGAVEAKGRLET